MLKQAFDFLFTPVKFPYGQQIGFLPERLEIRPRSDGIHLHPVIEPEPFEPQRQHVAHRHPRHIDQRGCTQAVDMCRREELV